MAKVEPLGMPFEQALIELTHGQVLRRSGERRRPRRRSSPRNVGSASSMPSRPERCEAELAAVASRRRRGKTRDYTALTPQELAVTRLVVSGMTNREVAEELMLSTKTVEFHLGHVYAKLGIRTRSDLRARARANELALTPRRRGAKPSTCARSRSRACLSPPGSTTVAVTFAGISTSSGNVPSVRRQPLRIGPRTEWYVARAQASPAGARATRARSRPAPRGAAGAPPTPSQPLRDRAQRRGG